MIYPLQRLKPNTYIKLNTKTQNIFCRLNQNLMTFLYTLTGVTRKQKEKKMFSLLKCIQKSNVVKKIGVLVFSFSRCNGLIICREKPSITGPKSALKTQLICKFLEIITGKK